MPRRRVKKQQRLQGDGFWDTLTSWGRTLRDYPKLIADGPVATPQGSVSSSGLPDKSILKDIADNSYKGTSDDMKDIPGFTLKLKTPTLVIYQKDGDNVMVIGVRGTADFRDFRAWFSTAFNVIPDSERFKEDIAEVAKFQQQYPLSAYTYYATGHSLGGTLIDELIKKGMVKEARTYNPAIETDDIPNVALSQKNHRIYADGDPLYLLQGRYDNPTEVRKSYKYYPSSAYDFVPGYDKYKQHVLANPVFVGGADDERRNEIRRLDREEQAAGQAGDRNRQSAIIAEIHRLRTTPEDYAEDEADRAEFLRNYPLALRHFPADYWIVPRNRNYYIESEQLLEGSTRAQRAAAAAAPTRIDINTNPEFIAERREFQAQRAAQRAEEARIAAAAAAAAAAAIPAIPLTPQQASRSNTPSRMRGNGNPFFHLQGAGMMANSQFYRTDPKRLKGQGFFDDVKKGIEGVYGKAPISAHHVWTPAEQADINRRQRITDVDKQRAKMVSSRVDYAYKNIMDNAQHKNVLQGYFKSVGTDNVKDYVAKVRELANKAAEEFYPY